MSLKLLKQSVDIIEEDFEQKNCNKAKKCNTKKNNDRKSRNYQILNYQKQKKNIEEVKHELKSSNKKSENNIKRLLALSMNTIELKDAEKMVQRAHKGRYMEKVIPAVQQESIFTEEDFRKFEEEYFSM